MYNCQYICQHTCVICIQPNIPTDAEDRTRPVAHGPASPNGKVPQVRCMVYFMKNPTGMDDTWGTPTLGHLN